MVSLYVSLVYLINPQQVQLISFCFFHVDPNIMVANIVNRFSHLEFSLWRYHHAIPFPITYVYASPDFIQTLPISYSPVVGRGK